MLQISSRKFFSTDRYYETPREGTFYTNYCGFAEGPIATVCGSLTVGEAIKDLSTLHYNMVERIEWKDMAPGVMIATGGEELINDFADVVAFGLNITCTTSKGIAQRLLEQNKEDRDGYKHPRKYLARVFDKKVQAVPGDAAMLDGFISALLGLPRKEYEGAIRAIRRYVTATHRISDDTNLAYALFVMSIEVLAQTAEPLMTDWSDYDEQKRRGIDKALKGADAAIADSVRAAVLANEHVVITRRFRDFAADHLNRDFFRSEAAGAIQPVSRPDLTPLLKRAYDIRSGYVHRLKDVPKLLSPPFNHAEVMHIERQPTLTFQGLARLARHIIMQFVQRAPKIEHEDFNWRAALPNLLTMEWAPQYWIGRPERYGPETAKTWLEAFLTQASAVFARSPGAILTNLGPILDRIESLPLGGIKAPDRRRIITLYHLFTVLAGPDHQRQQHEALLKRYEADFKEPTVEELVVRLVTGEALPWSLDELEQLHAAYYRDRRSKRTLMIGEFFEAVFTLRFADIQRHCGNQTRARELVAFAVEALPGNATLRAFEEGLKAKVIGPINDQEILLGQSVSVLVPTASASPGKSE